LELPQLIALLVGSLAAASAGGFWYYMRILAQMPESKTEQLLNPRTERLNHATREEDFESSEPSDEDIELEKIKRITSTKQLVRGKRDGIKTKLFKAGYYSKESVRRFVIFQIVSLLIGITSVPIIVWKMTDHSLSTLLAVFIGALIGLVYPIAKLDRKIEQRKHKILIHLPLVIEQIAIGFSSSLVIAACISSIVEMADERNSHNPVTELLEQVVRLVHAGYSFENAMTQVSSAMGMPAVEHTFNYLIQCSKHGGEITKQLQELANSTMTERNIKIHGKIAGLPAEATAPLGLVFSGFFIILVGGVFVRLLEVLPG
jgi:pilus assembly protein TadC